MANPLFVYGTLSDLDLLEAVLGHRVDPAGIAGAVAPGFVALHYPGRPYPALVRKPGGAAPGLLLLNLSSFDRDLLDAFEGEEYRRQPIPVMVDVELHEADAYLPAIAIPAEAEPWTLEGWRTRHKPTVLAGEAANAEILRRRLIAIRPN